MEEVNMPIPRVKVVDESIVTVVDAFVLTFFVNESHEELVIRVESIVGMYADLVGLDSIPYRLDEDGEILDIGANNAKELQYELFHLDPEADTSVIRLVGAVDDQTGYGFNYIADHLPDPRYPDLRNLISLWLPTPLCVTLGWQTVYDFSRSVSELLPYSFGYGSPCLAYGNDIRAAVGPARRYPGFDIALGMACRVDIDEKALGAYWLTFLGETLSQSLGGKAALASKLDPPITVEDISGTRIMIRLGPEPQVGDTNRQIEMPLYRKLTERIKNELHIPNNVYFPDERGIADKDAMTAWHKRFLPTD
jgi:hypothetical protein